MWNTLLIKIYCLEVSTYIQDLAKRRECPWWSGSPPSSWSRRAPTSSSPASSSSSCRRSCTPRLALGRFSSAGRIPLSIQRSKSALTWYLSVSWRNCCWYHWRGQMKLPVGKIWIKNKKKAIQQKFRSCSESYTYLCVGDLVTVVRAVAGETLQHPRLPIIRGQCGHWALGRKSVRRKAKKLSGL